MFNNTPNIVDQQDKFGLREVGITHPDLPSFIKLADNGDIHIVAAEGLGIIMHPQNKSITMVGDSVRFLTKEEDGLRWNKLSFNYQATKYTEPAFVSYEDDDYQNLYRGLDDWLE